MGPYDIYWYFTVWIVRREYSSGVLVGKERNGMFVCLKKPDRTINRTAVPFWGQSTHTLSSLSPKQDCSPKGHKAFHASDR